ncbi:ATP-dependent DNA helicase chl1 [Savitreella phatthalungensis]
MTTPTDGRTFHHPYQPYDIQLEFMRALYETLDNGQIGIFESPTGTGKTLSLICGALTWLRDRSSQDGGVLDSAGDDKLSFSAPDTTSDPPWLVAQLEEQRLKDRLAHAQRLEHKLDEIRREEAKRHRSEANRAQKRRRIDEQEASGPFEQREEDFLVDTEPGTIHQTAADGNNYSPEVLKLLQQMGHPSLEKQKEDEYPSTRKILFASRTHSQLQQFSSELKRVPIHRSDATNHHACDARHVALASRKNLCIHPTISRLSGEAVNETCLELQESKTAADKRCAFLPKESTPKHLYRDRTLATIQDIEELVTLGKQLSVCPYYGTRLAVPAAEVVTIPYPLLLSPVARQAAGLDLRGNVVVIDEAHNLIDAVASTFAAQITSSQLENASDLLEMYENKFRARLSGENRMFVAQLRVLVRSLCEFVASASRKEGLVDVTDLLSAGGDAINVPAITRYLTRSKLARKVDGYNKFTRGVAEKTTPVLHLVQNFLDRVASPSREGRFIFERAIPEAGGTMPEPRLRYLLLDPSDAFLPLVQDAHAIVLAGGTMSPANEHVDRLFPSARSRVRQFSCGHVVPASHLLVQTLSKGPGGVSLDFRHATRELPNVLDDLGRALLNLSAVIPDGMVAFFPSYAHLGSVVSRWKAAGLLDQLNRRKRVFQESRDCHAETLLRDYASAAVTDKGAILLSVVGGKLSEGINFSDRLGRAVLLVGLPFPDARSPEWRARLDYVSREAPTKDKPQAKADYLADLTMRAVNQAIGRVLRHKNDYAAIILCDIRWTGSAGDVAQGLRSRLPGWIRQSMPSTDPDKATFGATLTALAAFFKGHKQAPAQGG